MHFGVAAVVIVHDYSLAVLQFGAIVIFFSYNLANVLLLRVTAKGIRIAADKLDGE